MSVRGYMVVIAVYPWYRLGYYFKYVPIIHMVINNNYCRAIYTNFYKMITINYNQIYHVCV